MAKRITELTSATVLAETDLLPVVDVSDTTQATSGTTKKSALSLIADYLKARVETLTNKTLTSPVLNSADINTPDIDGGTIDGATISGGSIASDTDVIEVLKKVYPVGSIYINASVSTNPATLLGFGTWSAFGAGRTLVGIDSGDTDFDTVEETGGAKTHTHTLGDGFAKIGFHGSDLFENQDAVGSYTADRKCVISGTVGVSEATSRSTELGGSTDSSSNLQPYIVVYFWKRTA